MQGAAGLEAIAVRAEMPRMACMADWSRRSFRGVPASVRYRSTATGISKARIRRRCAASSARQAADGCGIYAARFPLTASGAYCGSR